MKRQELFDTLELLFYAVVCVAVILVFIIPALIFRVVQDEIRV
jgi:hypothetical protein